MESRSRRMLQLAQQKAQREVDDRQLNLPKYETTQTTSKEERDLCLRYFSTTPTRAYNLRNQQTSNLLVAETETKTPRPRPRQTESENANQHSQHEGESDDYRSSLEPYSGGSSEEYIPSADSESFSNTSNLDLSWSDHIFQNQVIKNRSKKNTRNIKQTHKKNESSRQSSKSNASENQKENLPLQDPIIDKEAQSSDIDVEISSPKRNIKTGKRVRNKRYSCFLCQKLVIHLPRHLMSMHSNDTSVARVLALPKNSSARRKEYAKLMREGNFYHNCEVLQLKKGELILLRRPTTLEKAKYTYFDYGPCPDCLGFMLKKNIHQHLKSKCDKNSKIDIGKRKPITESNSMLAAIQGADISAEFSTDIVMKMREDEVTKTCKEDLLILRYGFMMYEKFNITQSEWIRQSMRQVGRLLLEIKKVKFSLTLSEALKPQHFDLIVQATKNICVCTTSVANRPKYQTPSLALKVGHALKKCANYERGNALKRGNIKRNRELESFLSILDVEWSIRVSSNALNTLHTRKFNCTQLLPITNDLIKLNQYLNSEMTKLRLEIEKTNQPSPSCWSFFAALTLSRVLIFNKRRSGETARMTVDHYTMRPMWAEQTTEESKNAMTPFEKQLAEHFSVVEIPGKRGRKVPVLLSPEMKMAIDLLLRTRSVAGISKDNPYIFARSGLSLEHMRGHDALRKCCESANLQAPENINGTKLRKYVATVTQIINLTENETDWLARHLGHDVRVHREFYRLHESAVELTKVSRLLMAVDSGEAERFAGKKLSEIEISDLPHIEEDDNILENDECTSPRNTSSPVTSLELLESNVENGDNSKRATKIKKKKISTKTSWSTAESEAVLTFFKTSITMGKIPGKLQCEECIKKFAVLRARKWTDIKFHVKNYLYKIKKTLQ